MNAEKTDIKQKTAENPYAVEPQHGIFLVLEIEIFSRHNFGHFSPALSGI
jgi:hypothetical protein